MGPPKGWLPGYVPDRAVVFRTRDAILIAGPFDVYPTGAEFKFELQLRDEADELSELPWAFRHRRPERDDDLPDELLRLGVIYADGSSWSNLDSLEHPLTDDPPTGPVVLMRGGGGASGRWVMNQWLWPLPPDGPLTFVAEWPQYGVSESRSAVDGGKIRAAAEHAENLWPDEDSAQNL
jgi:hypothetical protein